MLGICGGYQMLGAVVADPGGIEGPPGSTPGLGLLPVQTELKAPKTTTCTRFSWARETGAGYEIHMGCTRRSDGGEPLLQIRARNGANCSDTDGCISDDGRVIGTYLHGLFDAPAVTGQWLDRIGLAGVSRDRTEGPAARNRAYDSLADHAQRHLDFTTIDRLAGMTEKSTCPDCRDDRMEAVKR